MKIDLDNIEQNEEQIIKETGTFLFNELYDLIYDYQNESDNDTDNFEDFIYDEFCSGEFVEDILHILKKYI